jgi:hypothetical protein
MARHALSVLALLSLLAGAHCCVFLMGESPNSVAAHPAGMYQTIRGSSVPQTPSVLHDWRLYVPFRLEALTVAS